MFRSPHPVDRKHLWLLPLAALLTVLPLLLHGSCGHDLLFHVQNWIDASNQLRHGDYPHWTTTAAWNAGEPRFVFYPPLSWILGALLTLIFPIAAVPAIFIFIAIATAGLTFHHLARQFAGPNAALIASALYLANPYLLFCAFERSALAELLAAAWIPLLLLAALRQRPTLRSLAVPIALLWLTNAPAAVIGSYALALIASLRILFCVVRKTLSPPGSIYATATQLHADSPTSQPGFSTGLLSSTSKKPHFSSWGKLSLSQPVSPLLLALTYIFGTILGLSLSAFYLLPAAYERSFVQIAMAVIPSLRPEDNFLFAHTSDAAHNAVNHTATLLALTLLASTVAALIALWIRTRNHPIPTEPQTTHQDPHTPHLHLVHPHRIDAGIPPPRYLLPILAILTAIIALMLTPLSAFIWRYLPELAFLQFPWRLLTLLTPVLALAIAILLGYPAQPPQSAQNPSPSHLPIAILARALALLLPLALTLLCFHLYAQPCDPADTPATLAQLLANHHGTLPTDEYTPADADNNLLRSDNPAFWLIPQPANQPGNTSADPNTPAPNTIPTATQLNPAIDTDDTPIPLAQTISTPAPHHLNLNLDHPAILVLNLRDYPSWRVTNLNTPTYPTRLHRLDGLIAIPLPSGRTTLHIEWDNTDDQTLGLILSILALLALILPTASTLRRRPHQS